MTEVLVPQWIESMYAPSAGQNHLGLTSVSNGEILPSLSPGVIVQTIHPRYHSFYAFVLEEFWTRPLPRTKAALIEFYRPCECIYSIACQLCDREAHPGTSGVIGSQKTSALASQHRPEYDPTFEYIETPLGGMDLYYRGVMRDLGLTILGGHGTFVPLRSGEGEATFPIDFPTMMGSKLATAFRAAVAETEYYKTYFGTSDPVPLEVVEEYGRAACLCALQAAGAADHALLLDLFLHSGPGDEPKRRRATFRLFLDIVAKAEGPVREGDFRRFIYFGQSGDAPYEPLGEVRDVLARWRLYQAREYYAFALNAIWAYFCAWGLRAGGDVRALSAEQFIAHCSEGIAFDELATALGLAAPGLSLASPWAALSDWILSTVGAAQAVEYDARCTLGEKLQEDALHQFADGKVTEAVDGLTAMVLMLAVLALRFAGPQLRARPEWEVAQMGRRERLSFDGFLHDIEKLTEDASTTIEQVLRFLVERYVVAQHLMTARSKLPENTFRFERDEEGLRFHDLPNPVEFTDARFSAVSTHLHELGLCSRFAAAEHWLSSEGEKLLSTGDVPA